MLNTLKNIKSSAYDPDFYNRIRNQSVGSVIKYYATLGLWLGILATVFGLVILTPKTYYNVQILEKEVLTYYPKDLEVKLSKGEITTNAKEPYALPFPDVIKKGFYDPVYKASNKIDAPNIENALVIGTKLDHIISIEEFKSIKTAFFLGKNYAVAYNDKGSITFTDLSKAHDVTVNRTFVERILGYAHFLPFLIPIFCFVIVFALVLFSLLWIIVLGALLFIILKLAKQKLSYAESYKVAAYAATLPMIVGLLAITLHLPVGYYVLDIITLVIAFVNTKPVSTT